MFGGLEDSLFSSDEPSFLSAVRPRLPVTEQPNEQSDLVDGSSYVEPSANSGRPCKLNVLAVDTPARFACSTGRGGFGVWTQF